MIAIMQRQKKLLSIILALALTLGVFSIIPLKVSAAVGTVFTDGAFTFTVTDDYTVQLTGFDNSTSIVVIPEKASNDDVEYTVTSIANSSEAFNANNYIDSVTIPGTITSMGYAFQNCTFLSEVILEEGITTLNGSIFSNCSSLQEIKFPKSLTYVAAGTFGNCTSLKDVYIYSDIDLKANAFRGCTALESFHCYSENITFATASIPAASTLSSDFTVYGYEGSTAQTYAETRGYNFVIIEEPATTEATTEPETTAYEEPDPEPTDTYIVAGTEEVFGVNWDGTAVANMMTDTDGDGIYTLTLTNVQPITGAEFKIVKNGTEWIGDPDLSGPYNNFTFTVESVSDITFSYNTETTEVTVNIEPVCYFTWETTNDDTAVKITGLKTEFKNETTIEIPSEINGLPVTVIGASAFSREKFTAVTIPATVTTIEEKAFYYNSYLTTLTLAENSQLEIIGDSAFAETKIRGIVIPASVTEIGSKAFYKTYVTSLEFENNSSLQTIGSSAFESSQLMYINIPSSVITIEDKAFYQCGNIKTVTFEDNSQLQVIGDQAFYRNQGQNDYLNELILPASLKQIGVKAFYNRENLLTVKVLSTDVVYGDSEGGGEVFDLYSADSNLKLYGYVGSTTQAYAEANNHTFRDIELDTTELKALLATARAYEASGYTEESYNNLQTVIDETYEIYKKAVKWEVTHIEVDQAVADLQAAIDGLVPYVEPTTVEPTTSPIEYVEYTLGDVDGEDGIKIDDVTAIQKYIVELIDLSYSQQLAADVNADGIRNIEDATLLQMWIAEYEEAMGYGIGETFTSEVTPTNPDTTDPVTTDPVVTEPDDDTFTLYVPNYVSWITNDGGKLWVYNNATEEFLLMDYDGDENLFYSEDLPVDWTDISIYRTPYSTNEDDFDINDPWDEENNSGTILNKWTALGDRGDNDCVFITADGEGYWTVYDSGSDSDKETERTIYFDNSITQWSVVYIYGWSCGIYDEFVAMEYEGNNIWSYTFYDELPTDGVQFFLFNNGSSWTNNANQTKDIATEKGKNLFVPSGRLQSQGKQDGSWQVYEP